MDLFLTAIKSVFDNLGATIMLPIIIFLVGIILGSKPGKAFRAGVIIGIAFIGINLVIGLMWGTLSEVGQAMVTNLGVQKDIVDVGWPGAAAIAYGTRVGLWVIPIALLINIIMLALNWTKTLNIDVWNFWHFAYLGSLVAIISGSLAYGLIAAALAAVLALFLADWTAPAVQKFYGLPGISIPHLTSAPGVPFAIVTNWIIDRIPGVKDWKVDDEAIQKRLGVFGDPVILGLIIGLVLGALGFYNAGDAATVATKILQTGMSLAAVMLLLPRMVQILMEGLIPISETAREFMNKKAHGRALYIGLDSAILTGHTAAITSSLVIVPIAILLSIILPGSRVILFADLAVIPFVVAMYAPLMKGNIFRMIVAGTLELIAGFYIATAAAGTFTASAIEAGFAIPEGTTKITSIADGFMWTTAVFSGAGKLGWIGLVLLAAVLGVVIFFYKKNEKAWEKIAGAEQE